jgi:hypothetical protein
LIGQGQLQTGTFGNSSVGGKVVVYMSGLNGGGTGGSASFALVTATPATQSISGSNYYDGGGTWQTPNPGTINCTYSIATTGRMTLTGSGCGSGAPVFYLTATNTAFVMSTDTDVALGQIEPQVGSNFTTASVSGDLFSGTLEVVNQGAEAGVGVVSLNGSGSASSTNDFTSTNGQNSDQTSTSTVTVNSDGTIITSDHPTLVTGIVVSSTKVVIIDNQGSTYPTIQLVTQ